jgi:hypothetical protein
MFTDFRLKAGLQTWLFSAMNPIFFVEKMKKGEIK